MVHPVFYSCFYEDQIINPWQTFPLNIFQLSLFQLQYPQVCILMLSLYKQVAGSAIKKSLIRSYWPWCQRKSSSGCLIWVMWAPADKIQEQVIWRPSVNCQCNNAASVPAIGPSHHVWAGPDTGNHSFNQPPRRRTQRKDFSSKCMEIKIF